MYSVRPCYFAPMKEGWLMEKKLHAIIYSKCNFRCKFCNLAFRQNDSMASYTIDEFVLLVSQLLQLSTCFKFTGGEPTLNPMLIRDLEIVKDLGGYVFLDTNGSNPAILREVAEKGLVDVVGISLKGTTVKSALHNANISNDILCWTNPLKSIECVTNLGIDTIVTHVFNNESTIEDLHEFADMITPYPNVKLKINNLLFKQHRQKGLKRLDDERFAGMISQFLENSPQWRGRTIVIKDESAITEYDSIEFR